jgi:hypothetical protein
MIDYQHVFEIIVTVAPIAIASFVAVKVDARDLRTRLDGVDRQLAKMDNVLVLMAETKGQIALEASQRVMQGARLDELTKRFNEWTDERRAP